MVVVLRVTVCHLALKTSTAIITPMSASVVMAFNRREQALIEIARFRSFDFQIYLGHRLWDWKRKDGGKAKCTSKDFEKHGDDVMETLIGMGDDEREHPHWKSNCYNKK